MANHSSATVREETPYLNRTTRTDTIIDALKRKAESVLNDRSIDPQSRAVIRYALETNDPWLAKLVRYAGESESNVEVIDFSQPPRINEDDPNADKIAALTEMICRDGDQAGTRLAALLVLMANLEDSRHPKALANIVKHIAFARCGELNLNGMVNAQIAMLESDLFAAEAVYC